jgi:hypothetical protein
LRKEKKGGERGNLLDLPVPTSEVFFAVHRLQWVEKERRIKNQVDWLKRRHGDSSLFLPGIKPNQVKRPANHVQDIEIRPKPIIRKVRSRAIFLHFGSHFDSFFLFPHLPRFLFSAWMRCIGHSLYFYWTWPDHCFKLANFHHPLAVGISSARGPLWVWCSSRIDV